MLKRAFFCCSWLSWAANTILIVLQIKIIKRKPKNFGKTIRQEPANYFPLQDSPWIGTVNFDLRKPNFVIIHHTAQNGCPETLHTFTIPQSQVSAHYVICKDGTVHHMLNDYLRAWQAGLSKWGNNTDINSSSIGIELDNNGFEYFTDPQINSLLILLDTLKNKYKIPQENFIGHGDIAPGRKVDPNWRFPWKLLADHGFRNLVWRYLRRGCAARISTIFRPCASSDIILRTVWQQSPLSGVTGCRIQFISLLTALGKNSFQSFHVNTNKKNHRVVVLFHDTYADIYKWDDEL